MDVTQTLGLVGYFVVVSAISIAMGVRRRVPHPSEGAAAWQRDPWHAPPSSFIGAREQARASFVCSYDADFEGSECYRTVAHAYPESGWRFRYDPVRDEAPSLDWGSCVPEAQRGHERVERRNRLVPPKLGQLRTV